MQLLHVGRRAVTGLAFAPDGRALVAGAQYDVPRLWELPATGDAVRLAPTPGEPRHFTFSADSTRIGWLSWHSRHEYDRGTGATSAVPLGERGELTLGQCMCGPDARLVVRTHQAPTGPRLRAFDPDDKGGWAEAWTVGPADALYGFPGWPVAGCAADRFFTWEMPGWGRSGPRRLVARSMATGAILAAASLSARYMTGLAAAPDGSAVVGFRDSSLFAWRPGAKVLKVRTGTRMHYRALAFHPDGRHLLAGNNDMTARLIDTRLWQVVRQYAWDVGKLTAVAVSPDGALAAAGGEAGRVVVWDLDV